MDFLKKNKKLMNSRKICIFIFFLGFFSSCRDVYCDEIIIELENNSCNWNQGKCLIDMRDIFKGTWDHLYIFDGFNTPEDISSALGFLYDGKPIYDHMRLVLHVSGKKVVSSYHTECVALNLGKVLTNGYLKVDADKPKMYLSKEKFLKKTVYVFENQ